MTRKTHDVGGQQLTVEQICARSKCRPTAVRNRIRRGVAGAALLKRPEPRSVRHRVGDRHMTVAEIAAHVGVQPSTIKERLRKGLRGLALLARVLRRSELEPVDCHGDRG